MKYKIGDVVELDKHVSISGTLSCDESGKLIFRKENQSLRPIQKICLDNIDSLDNLFFKSINVER